ncbi:hypothetical protein ACVIGA_005646 [Bradyrhizobium sp. USDA 3240]
MAPSVFDGAPLSLPHPVFDLGEGLFDRVEVGRVSRQVPGPGASSLDHLPDSFRLVASELVENDDVAFAQGWQEKVLHIGAEAFAVDRAVEDAGCRELVMAERAEECEGTPVTVRGEAAQACALGALAPQRGHVGLDPSLIDEDEPARIKSGLAVKHHLMEEPSIRLAPRNVSWSLIFPRAGVSGSAVRRKRCRSR